MMGDWSVCVQMRSPATRDGADEVLLRAELEYRRRIERMGRGLFLELEGAGAR